MAHRIVFPSNERIISIDPPSTSLPGAGGSDSSADNSYHRHGTYFFQDGNITFLVDGTLYCVHRYFFSRDSSYFSTKFTHLGVRDHEPLRTTVSLNDIKRKDFEAFLSVIYPENFEEHNLSYEQWVSVLHLSSCWGFASLRKLALKSIKPPNACEQLLLARTHGVESWVVPALSALCKRKQPISLKEARQMSIEDVVLVATIRERIRDQSFRAITARDPGQIEPAEAGVSANVASDDAPLVIPERDIAEEYPKQAVAGSSTEAGSHDYAEGAAVAIPSEEGSSTHGAHGGNLTGAIEKLQKEIIDRMYEQLPTSKTASEDSTAETDREGEYPEEAWAEYQ